MNRYEILNQVYTNKVKTVIQENYRIKTIEIDHRMDCLPGQFLMVWIPGSGERPMSIGNADPLTISVANVGKVSGEIVNLVEGDRISYRGPFGNPFTIPKNAKKILCIGGGYGVVPMYFLARKAKEAGVNAIAVIGAKSENDIVWEKQLFVVCERVHITTDDGSKGKKGTVMIEVNELVEDVDAVYACGPEKMMAAVAKLCREKKKFCEVSIERIMKCGVGICGSCAINGKLCCMDGPVFTGEEALAMEEFGK
ncbi:dihydroorotate dehydrogenase electron transfer subunit [Candidatus Micrarchaeota archaeon]|nr:dihydroorotate dehydrogenase electron transfer subunit [Candidatus Micrarchaeota archaeon]